MPIFQAFCLLEKSRLQDSHQATFLQCVTAKPGLKSKAPLAFLVLL